VVEPLDGCVRDYVGDRTGGSVGGGIGAKSLILMLGIG
jgi:hypothetical protein